MQTTKLLAIGLLSNAIVQNTHATLSSSGNGLGVYASLPDLTWTSDANLLGTFEAKEIAEYGNASSLIARIISSSGGVIHDAPNDYDTPTYSGVYILSESDFGNGGTVNWWGAQAFVHYLNYINYSNSTKWVLPTTIDSPSSYSYPLPPNSSQFAELFYTELGGTAGYNFPQNPLFFNVQVDGNTYWSSTEASSTPGGAWSFVTYDGAQIIGSKDNQAYAWAVSPGQLANVPLPGAIWLMVCGLMGLYGLRRY